MITEDLDIQTDDNGNITGVTNTIKTNTMSVQELAHMIRSMPEEQRTKFGKNCRVVGVLPMYSPDGAFQEDFTTMKADPDQLDWFLKNFPEFRTD